MNIFVDKGEEPFKIVARGFIKSTKEPVQCTVCLCGNGLGVDFDLPMSREKVPVGKEAVLGDRIRSDRPTPSFVAFGPFL